MINERKVSRKLFVSTVIILILLAGLALLIMNDHYQKKINELLEEKSSITILDTNNGEMPIQTIE